MSRKQEKERDSFPRLRKRKHLDFPGHRYGVQYVRQESNGGSMGPGALENPLTGCVSRTQPLVCFAEGWS